MWMSEVVGRNAKAVLFTGVAFVLGSCGPAPAPVPTTRPRERLARRAAPLPPLKPPKQKTWEKCPVPKVLPPVKAGSPKAALMRRLSRAGRSPGKPKPIKRWKPAVVDFTISGNKHLLWYRMNRGRIRLVEKIPYKRFGKQFLGHHWRTPGELVIQVGQERFVRMIFRSRPGAAPLPKKGQRYRFQKVGMLPRWLKPRAKKITRRQVIVTDSGELWQGYCYAEHDNPEMPYCKSWGYGRILPSYKISSQTPAARSMKWKLPRPAGYRMVIKEYCLTCYKGRMGWILYAGGWYMKYVKDARDKRWIGHRVPLWMASMAYTPPGENPWGAESYTTNLYEACTGWPVAFHAQLSWGPKPYIAYYANERAELHFRYDGQHYATLAVPTGARPKFRPLK